MTALPAEGRRRAAIDGVYPEVDGGRFPVKRIIGDAFTVSADVFPDGHDEIRVRLRHRAPGSDDWQEVEMSGPDNDRWTATIQLDILGRHEYGIVAWVDHFRSWRRDLIVRAREDVVTPVDLRIGAGLARAAAGRAGERERHRLLQLASELEGDMDDAVRTGTGEDLKSLMDAHPDRHLQSTVDTPLTVVVEPRHARFGAWYELFPRSASSEPGRHGTFRDVIDRLDYVAGLGFDVLYLPPVHPIGTSFRKGPDNSLETTAGDPGVPWAIGDASGGHMSVHRELGTLEDFEALVAAADARGIRVALDLAFQTSPDHPWVKEHREWFRTRPDGSVQYAENPPKKYQDAYPLDFESEGWEALWMELLAVVRFWMDHGVRIFRVDNPHTKPFDFWEWLIDDVKSTDPDVIFLAEAFTWPKVMYRLAKLGFSQSYTYFTWRNSKEELTSYLEEITRPPISEYFRANLFTNTPDILHAYLQEGGRAAFEVRLVLAATLAASYGVYGPPFELLQDVPLREGSEEYLGSEKYQLRHWDLDDDASIAPLMRTVNAIRRGHPALQSDERLMFHETGDDATIAYSKRTLAGDDTVLTIVNLDNKARRSAQVQLPLADLGIAGDVVRTHELLRDQRSELADGALRVDLDPADLPAAIFHLSAADASSARADTGASH